MKREDLLPRLVGHPSDHFGLPRRGVEQDWTACVGCSRMILSLGRRMYGDERLASPSIVGGRLEAASFAALETLTRQLYHCYWEDSKLLRLSRQIHSLR